MFYVVVESEKLKKIALTRRMLVSFGAVSTDIYFLVTGVPHLDPQVLFPAWHSPSYLPPRHDDCPREPCAPSARSAHPRDQVHDPGGQPRPQ